MDVATARRCVDACAEYLRSRDDSPKAAHDLADAVQVLAALGTDPVLADAITKILQSRWIDRGFGQFACRSCGAQRSVDYGDHETPMTEKREPCSRSCPWHVVETAFAR